MFDTSRGILSLSTEEFRALEKYLKVVKLILDCKDAAVRVSRTAWEQLEAKLLTVPDEKKRFSGERSFDSGVG
jgi:tRNA isopentenyl-2-thiomethyl-A-37 hydroxylase MiaE